MGSQRIVRRVAGQVRMLIVMSLLTLTLRGQADVIPPREDLPPNFLAGGSSSATSYTDAPGVSVLALLSEVYKDAAHYATQATNFEHGFFDVVMSS